MNFFEVPNIPQVVSKLIVFLLTIKEQTFLLKYDSIIYNPINYFFLNYSYDNITL